MLDEASFVSVVKNTPLVAIDLIVRDSLGNVLLGKRSNKPALDYWFVPGGRILKDETMELAFERITLAELGVSKALSEAKFAGVYEHFYSDNFLNDDFSTHYVVLGYELNLDIALESLPKSQHDEYSWWAIDDIIQSKDVHENSRRYFDV